MSGSIGFLTLGNCAESMSAVDLAARCSSEDSPIQNIFDRGVSDAAVKGTWIKMNVAVTVPLESFQVGEELKMMIFPREVAGEMEQEGIKKERRFAEKVVAKLKQMNLDRALPKKLASLLEAIKTFDFNNPILLDPDLPYLALAALNLGKITRSQVATICNFWGAYKQIRNHQNIQSVPLFDGNNINEEAKKLLMATFKIHGFQNTPPFLEGKKLDIFYEKMKELPKSEQRFLLIPTPYNGTIASGIKDLGINVFFQANDGKQVMQIVPSLGMMQAFLDAQYGDEAVKINPVLYLSTLHHIIETGLTHSRDMMFSFPNPDKHGKSHCPELADGLFAPWIDFTRHDLYHCIIASSLGKKLRRGYSDLALSMLDIAEKADSKQNQSSAQQLAIKLGDMEDSSHLHYRRNREKTDGQLFLEFCLLNYRKVRDFPELKSIITDYKIGTQLEG